MRRVSALAAFLLLATAANAQLAMTGFGPAGDAAELEPGGNACSTTSSSTQTFTSVATKGGGNNRIAIFSISWADTGAAGTAELASATYSGDPLTRAVRALPDDQNSNAEIWYVATNSQNGNLVLNFSTAVDRVTIQAYRLVRFPRQIPAQVQSGTTSITISNAANGAVLAVGTRSVAVDTDLSNLTENYSFSCGSGHWGVHSSAFPTSSGNLTSNISPTSSTPLIAAASWQPGADCSNSLVFSDGCNSQYMVLTGMY